ncbi:neuronal pentraxin-2 isoform X2 [Dunckerocampus dactyliophorus]|uniref:neuronal pentraxin-2 isoform X2 n=1 Tax=Dunckerocampus dactyliophorus TaxID=161453 RepID=UPI0024051236|nr:neuronal pentraxin-2 isoform X2 [Dunckerocampus dactyliophorus]
MFEAKVRMKMMKSPLSSSLLLLLSLLLWRSSCAPGSDFHDFSSAHPRFVCTPIPADVNPSCFPAADVGVGGGTHQSPPPVGWWGASEEAKASILHLRESLVRQKETILDQRETIRELTAKLALCEGFGGATHDEHSSDHAYPDINHHYGNLITDSLHSPSDGAHHQEKDVKHESSGDGPSSPEQMERMLQALKERLDNLQKRNSSLTSSSSLRQLLQRKIHALEEQLHQRTAALSGHSDRGDQNNRHHADDHRGHIDDRTDDDDRAVGINRTGQHFDQHSDGRHDGDNEDADDGHDGNEADGHAYMSHTGYREASHGGYHHNNLDTMLHQLHLAGSKSAEAFQISFPMRTNHMYGRMKSTLLQEIFALTLCLWIKAGVGHAMGTPFSYSAPGQPNELVLIEWGGNPVELLIDDKAVPLPLSLSDAKWHHVCVTWSTRDGHWEAYQDGVQRGSGINLAPWHPIKSGGVFILGQEQDTLGGRFDATQSFVGDMADVQMWSHVLSGADIHGLASCGSHLTGDVISWSQSGVELHGGVVRHAQEPCHSKT